MKCSSCDLTILSALLIKRLKKLCFKNSSIKIYERGLNKLDLYMRQLNLSSFSKSVGLKFIEYLEKLDPKVCPKTVIKFSKTLINRLVDELNNDFKICHFPSVLPIVNENFQTVIDEYCNYVSTFNSPGSVRHKRDTITKLCAYFEQAGGYSFLELNPVLIGQACLKFQNHGILWIVRDFLRYLFDKKILLADFSAIVPKHKQPQTVPSIYTEEELLKVGKAIKSEGETVKEKRDFAMFMLAAKLGLRCGDIVRLSIDNFNFSDKTLVLTTHKCPTFLQLALTDDIIDAVQEYYSVRPKSEYKELFLSLRAPFGNVTTSAFRFSLQNAFIKAGINTENKKKGPHVLRSSLASAMINKGVSYKTVRNILGHRDPKVMKHYAKVDIENLREYALPAPKATGKFLMFLNGGGI